MRLFLLSLITVLCSFAQASEYRCFVNYHEGQENGDLLFYGDTTGTGNNGGTAKTGTMRAEFIGANGFFSQLNLKTTQQDIVVGQHLNVSAAAVDDATSTYTIRSSYNAAIGNYTGSLNAARLNKTVTFPIRCVILRGF